MPRQAGVYGRGQELRRLPRGHSPQKVWLGLRAVPHRARLAGFRPADQESPEPLSPLWSSRGGAVRGVPQERGRGAIRRVIHGLRFLPYRGLPENDESESRRRQFSHDLRNLPFLRHMVERKV